ncbi:hypothetical protein BN7_5592 [Wickerhamomyces ciferrii]|uniref:Scaffold protein Nfu/NifU N-terminal domain-containing protein n=1 Tax=Wickerhamomyces ciferrii (strain ATCC 14091 / BCRC 22168 / CBS 111 / JCM 3599 / NBRC 0793 / NRRL Y-1031 F-60-10) TaxID=1206466 RepID=K0KL83_WICCF|nr:uncharacterized protein BN7_5592 [Wickerhamomyces ciferrii]CCH46005.1 hypothetical protein BN7_5592 [Wickerhamomyces ciferrii]
MFSIKSLPRVTKVNTKSNLSLLRLLHIQTFTTPNENALKFQIDQKILDDDVSSIQINQLNQSISPLASKIFQYSKDVESLMIGSNFITVNKDEFTHWNQVTPLIKTILENHIENNEDIIIAQSSNPAKQPHHDEHYAALSEEDQEISDLISELIETKIRPTIQEDGGDLIFMRYSEGKVYVQLQGACTSCSLSDDTLKSGIQGMLNHYIDGIDEVVNLAEVEFNKFEEKLKASKEARA